MSCQAAAGSEAVGRQQLVQRVDDGRVRQVCCRIRNLQQTAISSHVRPSVPAGGSREAVTLSQIQQALFVSSAPPGQHWQVSLSLEVGSFLLLWSVQHVTEAHLKQSAAACRDWSLPCRQAAWPRPCAAPESENGVRHCGTTYCCVS